MIAFVIYNTHEIKWYGCDAKFILPLPLYWRKNRGRSDLSKPRYRTFGTTAIKTMEYILREYAYILRECVSSDKILNVNIEYDKILNVSIN